MNDLGNPEKIRTAAREVAYPHLNRDYPHDFVSDDAYRRTLPDIQNGTSRSIPGARQTIQHVGIAGFRLPIRYRVRGGSEIFLETSVTGSVDLDATKRGINMSRIIRSFYTHSERSFDFEVMDEVLDDYVKDLESSDARLLMKLSYPALRNSLRSGLEGYQYYDVALELMKTGPEFARIIHLDYVYSSTCPCSLELSEHAREFRTQLATPHSQRSVARVSIRLAPGVESYWFEDLIDICRHAIPTETQVMVKREDEQAFAELNAANAIFVEDAVRRICEGLKRDTDIVDFRIVASHQESLHSHDAISILTEGPTFLQSSIDPALFGTLVHRTS